MSKRAAKKRIETTSTDTELRSVEAQPAIGPAHHGQAYARAPWARRWGVPGVSALVCLSAGWITSGIRDIAAPLDFAGDNMFHATLARVLAGQTWLWETPALGLPGALDFRLMPFSDVAHIAVLKVLALAGLGPFTCINVYFLAGFALVGATAAWVLERTGLRGGPAVLGALLYALLPYHFWRGTLHLFLGLYYTVPVFIYLMLGCLHLVDKREAPSTRAALVFSFLLASFGGYYAVFFCYLLGFGVVVEALSTRTWKPLWRGGRLIAATGAGVLVNTLPSLWFKMQHADPGKMIRPLQDTEIYALKFTQMLLPLMQHRTRWLADLALHYNRNAPIINENQSASLGLVMSAALVLVMAAASLAIWRDRPTDLALGGRIRRLALLAGWAFLFATLGGMSSGIGFFVTPFIRSANRMSIYIAFFVVVLAGWLWQQWRESQPHGDARRALWGAAGVICALLAMWDAADIDYYPRQAASAKLYREDAAFFTGLQRQTPQAKVFQLPFVRFPEGGLGDADYYHFRPYLHMDAWQWSFGALTGSQAETWNMQTAGMVGRDPKGFVQRLQQAGFTAVLLDRAIRGRDPSFSEAGLTAALGAPAMESPNREFAFFRLGN